MWNWDQGRMRYFQFDELRTVSRFAINYDLKNTPAQTIRQETGLDFPPHDDEYAPWRNYARVYRLCLIASDIADVAEPTDVAQILAIDGAVTCDEYLHFLVEATTSPSPALSNWTNTGRFRYPLSFSLKYILAKIAVLQINVSNINEIIGAYISSDFDGTECESDFVALFDSDDDYETMARQHPQSDHVRQARESIKFLCQLSYLHTHNSRIVATLNQDDAGNVFRELEPLGGTRLVDREQEIRRLAAYFKDGSTHDFFDYPNTTTSDELNSGFVEGSRVKRSHTVIERNSQLRSLFFHTLPTSVCDACGMDTHIKYPWTDRVLDMHHVLPLSSGTRVDSRKGTLLGDLIAICPTCHRSVHRYYDQYLNCGHKDDFSNKDEARSVYDKARMLIVGT